jgi:hypothetical protein
MPALPPPGAGDLVEGRLNMDLAAAAYYGVSVALWVFLTGLAVLAWLPDFPARLERHPRAMLVLLGVNRLQPDARPQLRKFYSYLAGGWTWILVWSWWLMPLCKQKFYPAAHSLKAFQLARTSMMILMISYAAFGFFCIGKAIQIWMKKIYSSNR